jgi:hypothetical protein
MSFFMILMLMQALPADAAYLDDAGTITVTATRLEDLAAAARRCERRGCPTREDIAVSVSYASALFDAGNYRESKRLLAAAVARTRGATRAEPIAVSLLYQAQATLSTHEGDQVTTRRATWASRNVLANAPNVPILSRLSAEFRVADWQLRTGDRIAAEARFRAIAKQARAAGNDALADVADLRRALALSAMRRRLESRALLEAMAARTDPGSVDVRRAALATAARLASVTDGKAAADAFTTRLAGIAAGDEPHLVSAPPFPTPGAPTPNDPLTLVSVDRGPRSAAIAGLLWVDIGFRIKPDGSVGEVSILRGSKQIDWARQLVDYISGRLYSGFMPQAADRAGRYRVERYTMTADYGTPIGSLVRRRIENPRFEMMEMTAEGPS